MADARTQIGNIQSIQDEPRALSSVRKKIWGRKHNERNKPKRYRSPLKELPVAKLDQFKQQIKEYCIIIQSIR